MIRLFFMVYNQNSVLATGLKGCAHEVVGVAIFIWSPVCHCAPEPGKEPTLPANLEMQAFVYSCGDPKQEHHLEFKY